MIAVVGGTDAMQALQDGAYQSATLIVYDVTQSGSPELTRFGNADIIANSLTVSKSCAGNGYLEIGSTVSDELQASIRTTALIAGSLKGCKVNLIIDWEYGTRQTESLYVFTGVVTEVKRASNGIFHITALDAMIMFDAPYKLGELKKHGTTTALSYPVSVIDLVKSIVWSKGAPYIDVNTILTSASPINLNANATVSNIPEDQGYTFRQVLSWCAQWMGVNLRIAAGGSTSAMEMWLWKVPTQIGDITDCSEEPYGITEGNTYRIDVDETRLLAPRFAIVSGETYLYESSYSSSYPGMISITANPIIINLHNNYNLAFQVYAGNIEDRIRNAFIDVVGDHCAGSFRSTPRWFLQPGDFVVSVSNRSADAHVVTSIIHRLNGSCAITAGGFEIRHSTDSNTPLPAFSDQQNNELVTRFHEICYAASDSFSGLLTAFGFITTSKTQLDITIPMQKFIPPGVTPEVSSCTIGMRHSVDTGGYVQSNGFDATQYISSVTTRGCGIKIVMTKSDGWLNSANGTTLPNNIAVCGQVTITCKFR